MFLVFGCSHSASLHFEGGQTATSHLVRLLRQMGGMVSFLVRRHVLAIAASVLVACNGYSHEELDNNGQAGLLHLEPTRARSFTLGPDGAFCGVEPPYPEKTCSCTEEVEGLVSQRGGTVDWSIDRRLRVTEGGR